VVLLPRVLLILNMAVRARPVQDENFVKGGGLLKGIIASFDQVEQAFDNATGNSVAYHPDRYIDSDEIYRARIYALFAMIDRDSDLTLDSTEFAKFLTKKGVAVPADLDAQFVKYDTNGNGTIDNDELAGVVKGLGLDEIVPDTEEAALYMVRP
jgi:Ca2+-binding EF-hand superfamily protein